MKKYVRLDGEQVRKLFIDEKLSLGKISGMTGATRTAVWKSLRRSGVDTSKVANAYVLATCHWCGKEVKRRRCRYHATDKAFCDKKCYYEWLGSSVYNPNRHGQRVARGFIMMYVRRMFGECDFVVHHKDGDNDNNRLDNLMVFPTQGDHMKWHRGGKGFACVMLDGTNA